MDFKIVKPVPKRVTSVNLTVTNADWLGNYCFENGFTRSFVVDKLIEAYRVEIANKKGGEL